ncbi:MHYT domain-containing protein [Granulicella sp. L46]|uniref:MHYT domain-containing protein n=1 Tax=Granulicella sp. L46 TaxID=1641865 RepID=UPI00131BD7B4|nr:MHYT domain-containing protein [Granulicella sp. L46]
MNQMMSGTYNYWLVALSFGVAILTSYTAIALVERVTASNGPVRRGWLIGGAIAMGSGIWCMHYTGMLAFQLPIPVRYHLPIVALSLLAAVLASLVALSVVSRRRMGWRDLLFGSVTMGAGIAAMHYIGMAAMRMEAMPVYHFEMLIASIIVAMLIASVGLTLLFRMRRWNHGKWPKLLVALILGLSIPVMHYMGMAAVSFRMTAEPIDYSYSIDISNLANFGIFGITGLILGFAMMTSFVDRHISAQDKALEGERKMLRALIDHIPDLMYVKDLEGRFVLSNLEHARRVGFPHPRFLIGKNDFDFYPFELAAKFRESELRVMSCGEALTEHEELPPDGNGCSVFLLTTKVPLRDGKGKITGIAGVGRDISELKRSETALRAAEQKYRSIYDEAPVGIFSLRADGFLIQVNSTMAQFLGYASPEEMYSLVTGSLWASAVSQQIHGEFLKMINRDGYVKAFELEVLRRDGGRIWISSSVRAKYDGLTIVGYSGMFEDITERRNLREQLLQAQKLESVGQLAAGIAHEINTPVQYIGDNVRFLRDSFDSLVALNGTYAELLARACDQTLEPELLRKVSAAVQEADVEYILEEIPKAFTQTLEGVSRVAGLVGAMKEFSHPGTGEKVPFDLNRAIENTVTVTRNEWKYLAEMRLSLEAGLPLVSCLPGAFNQVIVNLIVNAVHAIADAIDAGDVAKGLISIQTRSLGESVEIRIQDNGGGIPEAIRTRIFDPFFTTKEIGKGTGQGLAIARSVVVDKHQGSIDIETEIGLGTTFIIRLPCDAVQPALQAQVAA